MQKKLEYIAKYLADVSKLIMGIGVVTKLFGHESFMIKGVIIGLIVGGALAMLGWLIQPRG